MTPEGPVYSIYLSGKITGDPNYREKFAVATRTLQVKYPNATVFNPASEFRDIAAKLEMSGADKGVAHDILVDFCIQTMKDCDTIAIMPDWTDSKGAIAEVDAALREGMNVVWVEQDWLP